MNPVHAIRILGLVPIEAESIINPRWLLPLEYLSPSRADDSPQFAHPEAGLAHDLELASKLTVFTSTLGSWGH